MKVEVNLIIETYERSIQEVIDRLLENFSNQSGCASDMEIESLSIDRIKEYVDTV